jgi:hypothetical protein
MGRVWKGAVRATGEAVAVKVLNPELAADPEVVARFLQERGILVGLEHPHLVGVHDLVAEGDTLAIVMDLVQGSDLRKYLGEAGPLAPAFAAGLMAQVLTGLAAVHSVGIVHRDLKPENILLDLAHGDPPCARLSDFGIARLTTGPGLTRTTGLIGTPEYMAPEMAEQVEVGPPADIYAAGIVLYELLCGRTPFAGGAAVAILRRHIDEPPARPDGLPDALWQLVSEMLAKRPEQRPDAVQAADRLVALVPTLLATAPAAAEGVADADPNATRLPGHQPGRRPGEAVDTGRMAVPMPLGGAGPQRATAAAGDQQLTMLPGRARVPVALGGPLPVTRPGSRRTAMLIAGGVIAVLLVSVLSIGLIHRSSAKPTGAVPKTASATASIPPIPSLPPSGRVNDGALDTDFNRPGEQMGGFISESKPLDVALKVVVLPGGDRYLRVVTTSSVGGLDRIRTDALLSPARSVNVIIVVRAEGAPRLHGDLQIFTFPKVSAQPTIKAEAKYFYAEAGWTEVVSAPVTPLPGDTGIGVRIRFDSVPNAALEIQQVRYTFSSGPQLPQRGSASAPPTPT